MKVIFDIPSDVFERDGMQMVSGGRRGGIGGGGPGLTGMCYCSVGKGVLCEKNDEFKGTSDLVKVVLTGIVVSTRDIERCFRVVLFTTNL